MPEPVPPEVPLVAEMVTTDGMALAAAAETSLTELGLLMTKGAACWLDDVTVLLPCWSSRYKEPPPTSPPMSAAARTPPVNMPMPTFLRSLGRAVTAGAKAWGYAFDAG